METIAPSNPEQVTEEKPRTLKAKLKAFYEKYEKYTGLVIFGVGFIWDSLTMTRVDSVIDNVILLFYFVFIGAMIFLTVRRQCGRVPPAWIQKFEPKFLWAMQFCFGGLFSSYVIFYFKSASFTRTQFFFLILVCLWVGNEFLEQRLKNCMLLAVLYCFCLFSFLAFFLPVITTKVNFWIFLIAGFISLAVSLALFSFAFMADRDGWRNRMKPIGALIFSTFLLVNILYFANLIPPVPLALKDAGIYHNVQKTKAGYLVQYIPPPFYRFWRKWDDPFYYAPGEAVHCYAAVFAPRGVRLPVFHVWSRKTSAGWVRTDLLKVEIAGGSDEGWHVYTRKRNGIVPGKWRVEVETERGQTLGRIDFTVEPSPDPHPALETKVIY